MTTQPPSPLPPLPEQAARLVELGLIPHDSSTLTADDLRAAAADLAAQVPAGALLVVSEAILPPSVLTGQLRLPAPGRDPGDLEGFVVADMHDVDDFAPTITIPDAAVYAITEPQRGDEMRNWSPQEAQESLETQGRSPFTLAEGIHWALQDRQVLTRNSCYMTIGSRLRKPKGYDSRTPALWISNGTGRDGPARRGAPKVGWCWWNNRHTWLGFASAAQRVAAPTSAARFRDGSPDRCSKDEMGEQGFPE